MDTSHPAQVLRDALQELLEQASFNYEVPGTRAAINDAQRALARTIPPVAHERAVGVFRYDPGAGAFVPVEEELAKDRLGQLRPGYEYLFRQPPELASH